MENLVLSLSKDATHAPEPWFDEAHHGVGVRSPQCCILVLSLSKKATGESSV